VVLAVAGCGTTTLSATPPVATTPVPTPRMASEAPEMTPHRSASPTAAPGLVIAVDATLLDILPPTVGGVPMEPDPATAASLIGEADVSASTSGIAIGRYIGPGDSGGEDIVVASIVRLRPGIFSEPFFEAWRNDYDRSACEPAGGDTGDKGEVAIGSFPAHVATCAGGATTYHVHLDGDIIVSVLAIGPSTLGDQVIAGLRP
jgi:hypothetical protein